MSPSYGYNGGNGEVKKNTKVRGGREGGIHMGLGRGDMHKRNRESIGLNRDKALHPFTNNLLRKLRVV